MLTCRVDDIQLPPWAHGSPRLFIQKHRAALESDHVSRNLHYWIDLIFGHKQQGESAVKSCNVFHYLTYESTLDIQLLKNPAQREAYSDQICSFGQTPKQLFKHPHRPRKFFSSGLPVTPAELPSMKSPQLSPVQSPSLSFFLSTRHDTTPDQNDVIDDSMVAMVISEGSPFRDELGSNDNEEKDDLCEMIIPPPEDNRDSHVVPVSVQQDVIQGDMHENETLLSAISNQSSVPRRENDSNMITVEILSPPDVIGSTDAVIQSLGTQVEFPKSQEVSDQLQIGYQELQNFNLGWDGDTSADSDNAKSSNFQSSSICECVYDRTTVRDISVTLASNNNPLLSEPVFLPRDCILLPVPESCCNCFQFMLSFNVPDATFKIFYRPLFEHLDESKSPDMLWKDDNSAPTKLTCSEQSTTTGSVIIPQNDSHLIRGFDRKPDPQTSKELFSPACVRPDTKQIERKKWRFMCQVDLNGEHDLSVGRVSCVAFAGLASGATGALHGLGDIVLVAGSANVPSLHTISLSLHELYHRASYHYQDGRNRAFGRLVRVLSSCSILNIVPDFMPFHGIDLLEIIPQDVTTYTSNSTCIFSLMGDSSLYYWSFPLLPRGHYHHIVQQPSIFACIPNDSSYFLNFLTCDSVSNNVFACYGDEVLVYDINGNFLTKTSRIKSCQQQQKGIRALCVHPLSGFEQWCPFSGFLVGYSDGIIILWLSYHSRDIRHQEVSVSDYQQEEDIKERPVVALLSRSYMRRTCEDNDDQYEYTCVPVLQVGGSVITDNDQQSGVSAVSISPDGCYIVGGLVDGRGVRWEIGSC